jgi:dimethylhistidine N-methyltransferase
VKSAFARTSRSSAARAAPSDAIRAEVMYGLSQTPKALPCKLFYDARGSELFERICELPEYYPTRTELGILREHAAEMASALGADCALIEFGSGSSTKTLPLLGAMQGLRAYVPIEISRSALLSSAVALRTAYPTLEVLPVCADYTQPLRLPAITRQGRVTAFFPGSTIGNFDPPDAVAFLRQVRGYCGSSGQLLIGVDLKKDRATLEAAYDDREQVTAEFNRNILRVVNRECGADFSLDAFAHRAIWNERASRIEMHLVSRRSQAVNIGLDRVRFESGEHIVTEHCYKYELSDFAALVERASWRVTRVFTDAERTFSVQLLSGI